jgi:hypothetical protein
MTRPPLERRLPRAGAFVIQFRSGSTFEEGRVEGRVEHVASGLTVQFESWEQLVDVFTRVLKEVAADPGDGCGV